MRLPFRTIRHQILFLIFVVMFGAMSMLGVFATRKLRQSLTEQMIDTQKILAQSIHNGLSMTFDGIVGDIVKLANDPSMQHLDAGAQSSLSAFLRQNPLFVNAILYDRQGNVVAATERADPALAAMLVGRNLLRNANKLEALAASLEATIMNNQMHVSSQYSNTRQGRFLVINMPVRTWDRPDLVRGAVSIGMHLDGALLHEMLANFAVEDGFILLTDRDGHILAENGSYIPSDLVSARLDSIPVEGNPLTGWSSLRNSEYLIVARSFHQLAGVLLVGRSRSGIVAAVNSLAAELTGIALIPLLAAALLAWFIADRYLAQILALLHGLRQVGSGVFSSRVDVLSDDELGEAGEAFNVMAEGLERNHLVEEMWRDKWSGDK